MTLVETQHQQPATRVMVLMFTDIVDSVGLKSRIGPDMYTRLISRHDALLRSIMKPCAGADLMRDLGDGFLCRFQSTRDAVNVALRFQHALAVEPWGTEPIRVRIGIHLGEVAELAEDAEGNTKLVGLAADLSARIMGLALPGQILMTRSSFDDARQYVRDHPAATATDEATQLRWMAHGPYVFQGADDPLAIFEVGAAGYAPLTAPPDGDKARRAVPAGEESVYGWRPAIGLPIPRITHWVLERQLGEGGFGEVWLACHARTGTHRVFKFCFDADRLRSFKRELTLFRLLRETLGDRPDIARIHDIQLEQPPFFLESEFTDQGDLKDWADRRGGIAVVPMLVRLDLMARICDAVAAAHSVGILHKDLKPSNILIYEAEDGSPRPRLADFGIGAMTREASSLHQSSVTMSGFTETLVEASDSSQTGTRLYAPPESLVGGAFTIQGDVYTLGVILYQLVVGDFSRPLAQGWEQDVVDPTLRDDIACCVAGQPENRLTGALALARRLRALELRRSQYRRRHVARMAGASSVVLAVLLVVAAGLVVRERGMRRQIAEERDRAESQTAIVKEVNKFINEDLLAAVSPERTANRELTVREALDAAATRIEGRFEDQPLVDASIRLTLGDTYIQLGKYDLASPHIEKAVRLHTEILGDDHPDTLTAVAQLGVLRYYEGRHDEAAALFEDTLHRRQHILGVEHPSTLATMNGLAGVHRVMGRFDEAIRLQRDILETSERTLGEEDPSTLTATNNLAQLYFQMGQLDDAEPLYRRALETRRRTLGDEHPHTLTSINTLATLYFRQGRMEEAETLFHEVLATRRLVLGRDHPSTLVTQEAVADMYRKQGRDEEAVVLISESLEIRRASLGEEHLDTVATMNLLASAYTKLERFDEAEPLYLQSLETRERLLGADHPQVLSSLSNLGRLYSLQEQYDEALPFFTRAVEGADRSLPEGHWYRGIYLLRYGECLTGLDRFEDSEAVLLEAHGILSAVLGEQHARTVAVGEALIGLYTAWDRADEADLWRQRLAADAAPADAG